MHIRLQEVIMHQLLRLVMSLWFTTWKKKCVEKSKISKSRTRSWNSRYNYWRCKHANSTKEKKSSRKCTNRCSEPSIQTQIRTKALPVKVWSKVRKEKSSSWPKNTRSRSSKKNPKSRTWSKGYSRRNTTRKNLSWKWRKSRFRTRGKFRSSS